MYVTLQIQLDRDDKEFTKIELEVIEGIMNTCCSQLEKLSCVRAQMYVNDKAWRRE